jgi:hypothetical protein
VDLGSLRCWAVAGRLVGLPPPLFVCETVFTFADRLGLVPSSRGRRSHCGDLAWNSGADIAS